MKQTGKQKQRDAESAFTPQRQTQNRKRPQFHVTGND